MFNIVDATAWPLDETSEPLGTKEKDWLLGPANEQWLFKQARSTDRGTRGEDWAEKIVEQLGLHLGLPVATIELATRKGRRGILTPSFVPDGSRLEHGNELLVRIDPDYDKDRARHNERYTVDAVNLALADAAPPDAYLIEDFSAFDVWAGYLLLDAWVAGRDRHHENWAVISGPHGHRVLAPSFDHGNGLGFQESEENHLSLASDARALAKWADRGTSHHFGGRPLLVDLAREALGRASERARTIWMSQLVHVSEDDIVGIIEQVPAAIMSEASRTFCQRLLILNQGRLCDVG